MFQGPEYDVYDIIQQLYIHKTVFDSTGHDMGLVDGDCMFTDALEAIEKVADHVEFSYNEDYDTNLYKFQFDQMYEYFELCRKLARQKGIAFRNEPRVKEAEQFIDSEFQDIPDYCIGWNVFIPKKLNGNEKKTYSVLIELACEFYSYVPLVDSLYNIRDFFYKEEKKLRAEMESPKIITLPKPKSNPQRRAA